VLTLHKRKVKKFSRIRFFWFSYNYILSSFGLYRDAARSNSDEQPPFVFLMANSAGIQSCGPVPVTRTRFAPRSYSLCNNENRQISMIVYVFSQV
jgi:hypothetical protein